ncbi:polysaccharide deacetylase family protein [Sporosarcina sp. Te-1]|uniref:polysaccharide deacetylase family protein n=1 Tax=Sporosarcina sp. Te-1 TaxID=2818390 RepID=UPI001A9D37FB|nr:polysaccharide deacetylase family protein [Sporosarcina sp. Te-1]QTD39496.1 polysaccharide deacetylase family protein [Sporosarcina sp. Te-1]
MRKVYNSRHVLVSILLMGCLVLFVFAQFSFLNGSQGKAFAQFIQGDTSVKKIKMERVLTLEKNQPIYMREGTLIQIGELEAGQPIAIEGEDEAYYSVRFGKMIAFIPKGHGTVGPMKLLASTHEDQLASIKTVQRIQVYERADKQSSSFLQIEVGFRYPIVQETEDWYVIKLGERPGYIQKQSVVLDEGLPVLIYHHILPSDMVTTTASTISLESFEQQMAYLAERGFQTLAAQQLYDYLEGRLIVPSRSVVITFDDGLLSSKEYAYPLMKQYGFHAVQHIITSRTDRAQGTQLFDGKGPLQFLSAEEMADMRDVFEYQAHTHELHALTATETGNVGIALGLSQEEIMEDLQKNQEQLPSALSIAYPFGHYDKAFLAAAKEAGLLIGFTTEEGYADRSSSNYEVCRYGMTEKKSFAQFAQYVDGEMKWE